MSRIRTRGVKGVARPRPPALPRGVAWLQNPLLNKGTAFTEDEREALGLRGLLPPRVASIEDQVVRVMDNYRKKPNDLEKYVYLIGLQDRCETLFYRVLIENLEEMIPIIYTPTVGRACQEYGNLFRRPRGFYICANDRGEVARIMRNWPGKEVRAIVITDGERILGLGDLGTYGMGIPVGKLSLYSACAGVNPRLCMPVMLDVGTDNEKLMHDPLYTGLRQHRLRGPAYDELVDEFVAAARKLFPEALIQFEDFANSNAFRVLRKHRQHACVFNDDIQGTGAVALAGIRSALRITGGKLEEQRILFLGAGEAGIGIADTIVAALREAGVDEGIARRRCWLLDDRGMLVAGRKDLPAHATPYAHEVAACADLLAAIEAHKPTILIGVSAAPGTFNQPVIEAMAKLNQRPIIFSLSNPTSRAECTAEQAYEWSGGRAIFASGSPFAPVTIDGKTFVPGQCNNVYIFPGVGLGAITCEAKQITNSMFLRAARTLDSVVTDADLNQGRIYPSLTRIREVSWAIATAVAEEAYRLGLARRHRPEDLGAYIKAKMYEPVYASCI